MTLLIRVVTLGYLVQWSHFWIVLKILWYKLMAGQCFKSLMHWYSLGPLDHEEKLYIWLEKWSPINFYHKSPTLANHDCEY